MKTNFKNSQKEYEDINFPNNLDLSTENGIKKAQAEVRSKKRNRNLLNMCASLLVVTAVFTSAIGVSPTFAHSAEKATDSSKLAKVLRFVDGKARGGTITDGVDLESIDLIASKKSENIVLNFQNNDEDYDFTAAYKLKYTENPSIMSFEISGIRMISAKDDFDNIAKSPYVKEVYTIMTLDDSMVRFNIVFNQPIKYSVKEFSDTASLVLNISELDDSNKNDPKDKKEKKDKKDKKDKKNKKDKKEKKDKKDKKDKKNNKYKNDNKYTETQIYSLRTQSYKFSEYFAIVEESFMNIDKANNYRVIRDDNGEFVIEIEMFDSEASALKLKAQLESLLDETLIIEKRSSNDLPENITDEDINRASYGVSVSHNSSSYYANVVLTEDSIILYDEIYQNRVLAKYLYSEVNLSQLKGEASWILNIETSNDSIDLGGVYNDFFENLNYIQVSEVTNSNNK